MRVGFQDGSNVVRARAGRQNAGAKRSGEEGQVDAASEAILELRDITKSYPGVLANDRVNLSLRRGQVLGILGENGAGKSTLMNVVSGLIAPDSGEISVEGERVAFKSPRDALDRGIGMVHQHFMLVGTLSVIENIVLGDNRIGAGRISLEGPAAEVKELGERIGLPVEPHAEVGALDIGGQQRVEILKALYRDARILILDEPTSVLSRVDSTGLFQMIRSLAGEGVSVILISHKLDDIFAACDHVVAMRQGRVVGETAVSDTSHEALIRMMVGEDLEAPRRDEGLTAGEALVEVRDVTLDRDNGSLAIADVSFDLRAGEILGLAGVEGNGQRELVEALCGLRQPRAGRIIHSEAKKHGVNSVRGLRERGLCHVPENRHETGIVAGLSLAENVMLSHFFAAPFSRFGWLDRNAARDRTRELIETFDIKARGPGAPIETLSGGNQQKLVLARELDCNPSVLIAAHPTRGLDVRTIVFVHNLLLERRRAGMAILLVSSDLAEIWQLADRVMVAAGGSVRGPVAVADTDVQQVGTWMAAARR